MAAGAALVALLAVTGVLLLADREGERDAGDATTDITVRVSYEPSDVTLDDCSPRLRDDECLREALGALAYEAGPTAALDAMVEAYGEAGDMSCHAAAHEIGRAGLAHADGSVGDAFAAGSDACFSGYYHGIFETAFRGVERTPNALGSRARDLCDSAGATRTGFDQYNCLHGVGHGLLLSIGEDLEGAGHACRHIEGDARARECFGGVVMEAFEPSRGGRSPWIRPGQPEYPCAVLAGGEQQTCYAQLGARLLVEYRGDWSAAARACTSVTVSHRDLCAYSLGSEAANLRGWRAAPTIAMCSTITPYEAVCIEGAAAAVMANFGAAQPGLALCRVAPSAVRARCERRVARFIALLATSSDDARRECRALVPAALDACDHSLARR